MLFVNSSLIAQTPANAILSSFPWWFWVLLVVAGAAKVLSETAPKKRHRHNRWTGVNHDGTPHAVANGNLMPCPDCKKPISMKASTCPHCGAPIADDYVKTVQSERNLNRRRAQKTKDILIQKNGAFVTVVFFVSMLFFVFHFSSGVWTWILSAPLVLLMVASIFEVIKLGDKGYLGEEIVKQKLLQLRPKGSYKVLNDIYLPIEDGGTTQIDHIVVSPFGTFVVETKNYSGWIFADGKAPTWTQVLGKTKNQFQNPIRQNYLHLRSIVDNLGLPENLLHGIVAFADDCEFKTERPEGVVFFNELTSYISKFTDRVIENDDVDEIVKTIREWNDSVTAAQRSNHVNNLKTRHQR